MPLAGQEVPEILPESKIDSAANEVFQIILFLSQKAFENSIYSVFPSQEENRFILNFYDSSSELLKKYYLKKKLETIFIANYIKSISLNFDK